MDHSIRLLFAITLVVGAVFSLEVTPGSSCAAFCLDDPERDGFDPKASTTNTSEIMCKDLDFSTKDIGIKYKSCMQCLQKSKKVNESESDLHWYLYNMRYTISTCLFSIPAAPKNADVDSPCVIDYACRPLKGPLTADNLTSSADDTYGYCNADGGSFMGPKLQSCLSCLQSSGDQVYLSNFMTVLGAGCEQKTKPGEVLGITGTVFSRSPIIMSPPEENIHDKPKGAGSATLTTGTIVGIAVGCGLLLLGALALFIVYWRRKKKFERDEKKGLRGSLSGSPDPLFPPQGHQMSAPLRSYSGLGGAGGTHSRQDSLTAGDYYDKLEEEMGSGRLHYNYDPRAASRGPNSALPTHQAYNPGAVSRQPPEMHRPSPPSNPHHNPLSSYNIQPYLNTTGNEGQTHLPLPPPPPPPPQAMANPRNTVSNMPLPPPAQPKVPSLIMPSVRKLKLPKKYAPPTVTVQAATPTSVAPREVRISRPVMREDSGFDDMPLAGGIVFATQASAEHLSSQRANHGEVPMKSGNSALYG